MNNLEFGKLTRACFAAAKSNQSNLKCRPQEEKGDMAALQNCRMHILIDTAINVMQTKLDAMKKVRTAASNFKCVTGVSVAVKKDLISGQSYN